MDNLANPKTIIKDAEELAAKACHAIIVFSPSTERPVAS